MHRFPTAATADRNPSWLNALMGAMDFGMCTSGFEVSLQWQNGKLTMGTILSKIGGLCRVRYGDQELVLNTVKGYSLTKLVGVR